MVCEYYRNNEGDWQWEKKYQFVESLVSKSPCLPPNISDSTETKPFNFPS